MLIVFLPLILAVVAADDQNDPAQYQLADYRDRTMEPIDIVTTSSGAPVEYRDTSGMTGSMFSNEYLIEQLTSLDREKIPERLVHATGTGAFGYFEVTNDISGICKADLFSEVGKKTPVAARFSISAWSRGISETLRGSRGFAVKFYTEDGNFDLTGFNVPIFAHRDPFKVIALIRILHTNPVTNLPDPNMMWDFATINPETMFAFFYTFTDFGMPASYSDMTGHPVHTYQVYNEDGVSSYMRFHFIPVGGAKYLNSTEVLNLACGDPNIYTRQLYNKIGNCEHPSWYLKAQILTEEDRENADMDIFDVTKVLPLEQYPLHTIGKFTLNRNPSNHFADIEQLAFSPGNVVPGIVGSPDKIFETRRFAYRDAANYRLGSNFNKISVNCPIHSKTHTYIRDGRPPVKDNEKDAPNYYPNSFNGPRTFIDEKRPKLIKIYEEVPEHVPDNFGQVANFYTNELTEEQRVSFIETLLQSLCLTVDEIKHRAMKWFTLMDADLAHRVSMGLQNCKR